MEETNKQIIHTYRTLLKEFTEKLRRNLTRGEKEILQTLARDTKPSSF